LTINNIVSLASIFKDTHPDKNFNGVRGDGAGKPKRTLYVIDKSFHDVPLVGGGLSLAK
jgi:hypothetical protein